MHAEYHQQDRPPLKTQYYIEVPKNQTVNEGDTILLRCQVGNRQGVVQWTRNGFAMGKILYTQLVEMISVIVLSKVNYGVFNFPKKQTRFCP